MKIPAPEPLTEADLAELADVLDRRAVPNDGMSLEMLDGYLHAVVIGPEVILPSEWFPVVFGEAGEKSGPQWGSAAQFEDVFGLVVRQSNGIAAALRMGQAEWDPVILDYEVKGKTVTYAQEWAIGFLRGVHLRSAEWTPAIEHEEFATGWNAMHLLAAGPRDPEFGRRVRTQKQRHALIIEMLNAVEQMAAYWLDRPAQPAARPATVRRPGPKVGRNDPCPCGSGKKFKQCCGAAPTLH